MALEKAIFAAGCFWHVEEVFSKVKGVVKTRVGYAGGSSKNPSYKEVSSGKTGHAESVEVTFNTKEISYRKLLEIFWKMHNPTTLNRQGADIGTTYRSAIFYKNKKQKKEAEKSRTKAQKALRKKIVTEITPFSDFYPAEEYHQKYFEKHNNIFCELYLFLFK